MRNRPEGCAPAEASRLGLFQIAQYRHTALVKRHALGRELKARVERFTSLAAQPGFPTARPVCSPPSGVIRQARAAAEKPPSFHHPLEDFHFRQSD